jgi:hypothetical protein
MRLIVENLKNIIQADIEIAAAEDAHITRIAGPVGEGKSSILFALQALVTDNSLPAKGLLKKDAKQIVQDGKKSSQAVLTWGDNRAEIKWPACRIEGAKFGATKYAAGIVNPVDITSAELTELLKILPTKEEWFAETADVIDEETAQAVWDKITSSGWDGAETHSENRRREMKQDWEKLARTPYKPTNAGEFIPEGFIEGYTLEQLQAGLVTAQKLYEHAIKKEAVDEREKADLEALAAAKDSLEAELDAKIVAHGAAHEAASKAIQVLAELPTVLQQETVYITPCCNEAVKIFKGKLIKHEAQQTPEQAAAIQSRIDQQEAVIAELTRDRDAIAVDIKHLRDKIAASSEAAKKLRQVVPDDEDESAISAEDAKIEIDRATAGIVALRAKAECDELHDSIKINNYLCDTLSSDGLRKAVLTSKLETFNQLLASLCDCAGWPVIQMDEYLSPTFGGRPYVLLSTGQQRTVNVALQLAIAKYDGSQIVIFDRIQDMDSAYQRGLVELLSNISIPSVVAVTAKTADELLDYEARTYWCENGIALREKQPVAAK